MMSNTTANSNGKQCDCCLNNISDDSDHVLNFPCGHKICSFCFVTSTMKRANPACQVKDCPQKYTSSCQYFNRGIPGNVIENEVVWSEQCCNVLTPADTLSTDDLATIFGFLHIQDIMLRKRGVCKTWRVAAKKAKAINDAAIIDKVCTDSGVLTNVFAYLVPKEIMSLRRVCKMWKEAARKTTVPLNSYFNVDSVTNYNVMSVMTRALPNLQGLWLGRLGQGHKYSEGGDPDEWLVNETYDWTTHDIEIVSNFSKLRILEINALLNGRYPVLFNSFPLLQKLSIYDCYYLKWDLDMLAGSPSLKELYCRGNENLTGNISSLRVLKDTLEKVTISGCPHQRLSNVEGDFMDLADFPHLKMLNLEGTAVTGDIRDIGENDFSSLETLYLPKGVYGGTGVTTRELRRISDGPGVARAVYLLKKQRPTLIMGYWCWKLSRDSPDWYESMNIKYPPPLSFSLVQAGSSIGYRWQAFQYQWRRNVLCEVNWLDPEPSIESSDYAIYIEELQKIEKEREEEGRVDLYKGIHQPPTEDEYHSLLEEYDLLPPTPREEELM